MIKFLPIAVLVILVMGALTYRQYLLDLDNQNISKLSSQLIKQESGNPGDRMTNVEVAVARLIQKVNKLSPDASSSANPVTDSDRLQSLERSINDLKIRVSKLEDDKSVPPGAKLPVYIPLGIAGSTTSKDWVVSKAVEVTLNDQDYLGYTSIQIEFSAKVSQKDTLGKIRFYNSTDSLPLAVSETEVSSTEYSWITSPKFTFTPGNKTYRFQLKVEGGGEISLSDSRVKINF